MPADVSNATNFKYHSDFPLEKVVYLTSGSFDLPTAISPPHIIEIPHGLPFTPLVGGNWSLTSDFEVSYEFPIGPSDSSGLVQLVWAYADSTNVYISGENVSGTITVYYRVYGFQPPNDDSLVESTGNSGDEFIMNTDYNYPKLYLSGEVLLPATGGTEDSYTVTHDLGYIPQALTWVEYTMLTPSSTTTAVVPGYINNSSGDNIISVIGASSLGFAIPASMPATTAYYRIYLDS